MGTGEFSLKLYIKTIEDNCKTVLTTNGIYTENPNKDIPFIRIRCYLFRIKWLWKNRKWENCRQKFKRLDKDWKEYLRKRKK